MTGLPPAFALPPVGIDLRPSRYVGTSGPPKLERERFSGGVNLSARERNRKRTKEAYRLYGLDGILFCAPWLYELTKAAVPRG